MTVKETKFILKRATTSEERTEAMLKFFKAQPYYKELKEVETPQSSENFGELFSNTSLHT